MFKYIKVSNNHIRNRMWLLYIYNNFWTTDIYDPNIIYDVNLKRKLICL